MGLSSVRKIVTTWVGVITFIVSCAVMLGVDGQQGLQEAMVEITMDNMALQISPEEPYLDAT
jgi:hypothetical protein